MKAVKSNGLVQWYRKDAYRCGWEATYARSRRCRAVGKCFECYDGFPQRVSSFSLPPALVSRHGKRCGSCNQTDETIRQCREVYNRCVAGWRENMFKLTSCDYWPAVKSILALKVTNTKFIFILKWFPSLELLAVLGVGGVQLDVSAPAASAVTSGSGHVRATPALIV